MSRYITPPNMRAYQSVLFASALIGFACAASAITQADTLRGVVRDALRTNPELAAIRFNRQAIDQELRAARGLGLPSVDVRGNLGSHRDSLKTRLGIETTDPWHYHRDVSLIMSQRIFDGFERAHEVARQKHRVESARWRVADTANSIALRAVQAYFEIHRAMAVLAAANSNYNQLVGLRSRVMARVRAGHGDKAEASEAGSRVANARALVIEAQARLEDARSLFKSVVGRLPGRLKGAPLPHKALPRTVLIAVQEARRAAPSVVATEHDAVAARAAIGSAYSRLYPKLNLEVSGDFGRGVDGRGDRDLDARAMLVVRWTLFNGGINRARIEEAQARASEAGSIEDNTRLLVERQTRVSWTAMVAARTRIPVLRQRLALLRRTRAAYSSQFVTGERRLLDLLDSQNEIFLAEASLRTEVFVGQFNAYRVLASMGHLVWALGLELPAEAVFPHKRSVLDGWHARVSPHRHVHGGPQK